MGQYQPPYKGLFPQTIRLIINIHSKQADIEILSEDIALLSLEQTKEVKSQLQNVAKLITDELAKGQD